MIKKSDWAAAYRELIVEGRQRLDEPPEEEQLLAYFRGELSEEETARVREILVYYPELVRALEQPFSVPFEGKPGDAEVLSDEEMAQDWESLQARLGKTATAEISERSRRWWRWSKEKRQRRNVDEASAWNVEPLVRQLRVWRLSSAVAAMLAVTFFGLYLRTQWTAKQELSQPRVNLDHRLLMPDGQRGSVTAQPPVPLPSKTDYFLLIPALINHPQYPDYQLDIFDLSEAKPRKIWSRKGLRRRSDDTFNILVPRAFLKPSQYRLDLYGVEPGGQRQPLATYTIRFSPE